MLIPKSFSLSAAWVALALCAVGCAVYLTDLSALAEHWANTPDSSHGWLIAAAVPVLVWLRRDDVGAEATGWDIAAAIGLLVVALVLSAARSAGVDVLAALMLPAAVLLSCWFVLGKGAAKVLAFPITYFLFAIPIWAVLTPGLQWLTVKATSALLAAVGLVAFVDGSSVTVPAGTFEIAGGCSGTNYFVVALAVSTLLAGLDRLNARDAVRLVAAALALAIVANWVRVAVVIYIGNLSGMQSSLVHNHYAFGWWLFAAALVPFFVYARRLARRQPSPAMNRATGRPPSQIGTARLAVGAALLLAGPAWAHIVTRAADGPAAVIELPAIAGWTGPEAVAPDWRPEFPGAASERIGAYRLGSTEVDVYVAYYLSQRKGRKLIGYQSRIGGEDWTDREINDPPSTLPAGALFEHVLDNAGGRRRLVWTWYEVRGVRTRRPIEVKLRQALGGIGVSTTSGIVALSVACDSDCARARGSLEAAYRAGFDQLSAMPVSRSGVPRT